MTLCEHFAHLEPCVTILLAAGADPHCVNTAGQTACHLAAANCAAFCTLVAVLAAGADIDQVDNSGRSARQLALLSECPLPTNAEIGLARRRIAATRLNFVRQRALEVCIALHGLELDALQMCEIMLHSCGPVAHLIPFHQWWKIATTVKHHRDE